MDYFNNRFSTTLLIVVGILLLSVASIFTFMIFSQSNLEGKEGSLSTDTNLCKSETDTRYMQMLTNGVITNSESKINYRSRVIALDRNSSLFEKKYSLKLTLAIDQKTAADFFFSKTDIPKLRIYKLINSKEVKASVDDIKVDSNIAMEITTQFNKLREPKIIRAVILILD